jgi:hypothetical protein
MKIFVFVVSLLFATLSSFSQEQKNRYFELRIYYCHPGRLDALVERFTDHTTKLFEKHGMTNIGYWVPENNTENALYYILAYPDKKARDTSWSAFNADPVWVKVKTASEESGAIIKKIESVMMNPLEFSKIK